jgi:hypothetical protein
VLVLEHIECTSHALTFPMSGLDRYDDDEPVERAAELMRQFRVRRLVVLDHEAQVVGVISTADISGFLSKPRPFEVVLFKELLDDSGHVHHSELMRVSVGKGTREEAVRAAIREFEQMQRVRRWSALADGYEEVVSVDVDP